MFRLTELSDIDLDQLFNSETILLVEDDEAVREVTAGLLTEFGYRVFTAKDTDGGLAIVESGVPIDVLFTDVVMTGRLRSGDLARKAKERLPNLSVLFTSGYTENSIVHDERLDAEASLLSKPYTREALAQKIRQVIEQGRAGAQQRESEDPGLPPVAGPVVEQSAPVDLPITVLLVEDEVLIRISTADLLQDSGMNVVEAGSAHEALAAMGGHSIDILVTDVNLPEMSGPQLILKIRETLPYLPVIFATGDNDVPGMEALEHSAVIVKPYDYEILVAHICAMVSSRAGG